MTETDIREIVLQLLLDLTLRSNLAEMRPPRYQDVTFP
jgi:hypothetical protein